jgi:hypothetical protein
MELRGQGVRELVKGERRLMREDPDPLRPEPSAHEALVIAGREVDQAVDATLHAESSPAREVVQQELRRVASLRGLLRREEAFLGGGGLVEAIPVGAVWVGGAHARNVSVTLVSCKAAVTARSRFADRANKQATPLSAGDPARRSLQRFALDELARFTKERVFATSASRDFRLFYVGRDEVHGILRHLLSRATRSLDLNMFGYRSTRTCWSGSRKRGQSRADG